MKSKSTKASSAKQTKRATKPKKAATRAKSYASKAKPSRVSKIARTSSSKLTKNVTSLKKAPTSFKKTASSLKKTTSSLKKTTSSLKKAASSFKKGTTNQRRISLKVKDIMNKGILLMKPNDTLQQAARKMQEKDSGCVFVSEHDRLSGIVTDRDIVLRAISYGGSKFDTLKLKDIMSPKILYCFEEDTLQKAAQNMAKNQIRRLPVLNKQKRLVGVLSIGAIARHSAKEAGEALKKICKKK